MLALISRKNHLHALSEANPLSQIGALRIRLSGFAYGTWRDLHRGM